MIRLHFPGPMPADSATLGPAPFFRVGGNFIRQGPDGSVVARLTNHYWEVDGKHFTRYDCTQAVLLQFENADALTSEIFGPFRQLAVVDGVCYADGTLFVKFMKEIQLWHCYATDTYWPFLLIKPLSSEM